MASRPKRKNYPERFDLVSGLEKIINLRCFGEEERRKFWQIYSRAGAGKMTGNDTRFLKSLLGRFFDWKASQRPRKQGPRTFMHEIVRWVEPQPGDWTPEQLEPPF
jgi:hypothetical protein